MTAIHISIEQKKTLKMQFDVLAREDATDGEIKIARVIEDALIDVLKSIPGAAVKRDESVEGHNKIRGRLI
jgi:hypothetical protein